MGRLVRLCIRHGTSTVLAATKNEVPNVGPMNHAGMIRREQRRATQQPEFASMRQLANQAVSSESGGPWRDGNRVRVLKDASENYPAWLEAIEAARWTIHFEMYIIHDDDQGRLFAEALLRKASQGVRVRLLYDWMGGFGKTSRVFWNRLSAGGVDVRCYNPPRFDRRLG